MVATNLNTLDPTTVNEERFGRAPRVCLIIVNTYEKESLQLGPGPLNDSLTVAQNLSDFQYRIYFLHNTTPAHFLAWLKYFLEHATDSLFIFYTGHGASIKDRDGDEEDGMDEVMVFDNGHVVDDELSKYLRLYCKAQRTVLVTDCCHSGTIWDLAQKPNAQPIPPNILSISAALDNQTAKQSKMDRKDQGIFTFYFWKYFSENNQITPHQLEGLMNPSLAKYSQGIVVSTSSPDMLDGAILVPPVPRKGDGKPA
jgi:hypothetical protein